MVIFFRWSWTSSRGSATHEHLLRPVEIAAPTMRLVRVYPAGSTPVDGHRGVVTTVVAIGEQVSQAGFGGNCHRARERERGRLGIHEISISSLEEHFTLKVAFNNIFFVPFWSLQRVPSPRMGLPIGYPGKVIQRVSWSLERPSDPLIPAIPQGFQVPFVECDFQQ